MVIFEYLNNQEIINIIFCLAQFEFYHNSGSVL